MEEEMLGIMVREYCKRREKSIERKAGGKYNS